MVKFAIMPITLRNMYCGNVQYMKKEEYEMTVYEIAMFGFGILVCGGVVLFVVGSLVWAVVDAIRGCVKGYRRNKFEERCREANRRLERNNPEMYRKLYGKRNCDSSVI